MKVGGSTGGVNNTSNFPNNFTPNLLGTVEFNGATPQTVPAVSFTNLTISGTGVKTIGSSVAVSGSWLSQSGTTIVIPGGTTLQTMSFVNYGTITNSGVLQIGN